MRPTLPAAIGSSQLAAIAESLVTDAERSNRRVTCLLHIVSHGTRVRHAQGITPSILREFIACAATVQTSVLVLFGPSCLGQYSPLKLLHAHCLGLLLLSVCVFSKTTRFVFRQAKVYRVLAINGLRPHTKTKISRTRGRRAHRPMRRLFFWDVSIRNSLRSNYVDFCTNAW